MNSKIYSLLSLTLSSTTNRLNTRLFPLHCPAMSTLSPFFVSSSFKHNFSCITPQRVCLTPTDVRLMETQTNAYWLGMIEIGVLASQPLSLWQCVFCENVWLQSYNNIQHRNNSTHQCCLLPVLGGASRLHIHSLLFPGPPWGGAASLRWLCFTRIQGKEQGHPLLALHNPRPRHTEAHHTTL